MSFADSDPQRLENSRFRTTTELGCVHFDITYIYTPPPLDGRREGRLENAPPSIKKEGKKKEGVKERARKRGRGERAESLFFLAFFSRVLNSSSSTQIKIRFLFLFLLLFLSHRTFVSPVATVSWLRLFANLVQTIRI